MSTDKHVTFYHSPNSRSAGVLVLLEELNADYETFVLNLKAGEQRQAAYLAINPMGKVPAIKHGDAVVTEQAAVYQYLAELYPEAGLAPPIGSPLRGPFLRWLAFYGASFEPAVVDRAQKHAPAPPSTCPYGDFDTMLKTVTDQLARGPYILGEQFSAADVLWANALRWTTMFQLVPQTPVLQAYIERVTSRPAAARAAAKDQQLIAAQA
ncbi:glutathione S-transferase family protein [Aquabacterium sp. CECT 9606]|uniref:glutathione S-transferase family protein n=1 Tax=Aquabacterium sp. CECT 9606 TaxID=2845822 RepID=UPI001E3988A0|nr:glutathione S-transferase family protein [Aquabacterium sp. CECT 9606]CAH0355811.1 Disulfide-bond oxidoreductase YfcG [Aquabacterium sp. CECT 9606]